jgi:hypothetical protein
MNTRMTERNIPMSKSRIQALCPTSSEAMEVMLNAQVITRMLHGLCEHPRNHNADQAAATLELVQFERLLRLVEDPTGNLHFTDAATSLGVERVFETGEHVLQCRLALLREDLEGALGSAEKALRRWQRDGLETDPSQMTTWVFILPTDPALVAGTSKQ